MPGSNWHCYVSDPDGHTNEFYYGIEQVGWNDLSKPKAPTTVAFARSQSCRRFPRPQKSPKRCDDKGVDIFSGHRYEEQLPSRYEVEGVLLPRPFKITKIGPVHLFVDDVDAAEAFYTNVVGFVKTEESVYHGARCVFLRAGSEHTAWPCFPTNCVPPWGSALTPLANHSASKWGAISNYVRPLAF